VWRRYRQVVPKSINIEVTVLFNLSLVRSGHCAVAAVADPVQERLNQAGVGDGRQQQPQCAVPQEPEAEGSMLLPFSLFGYQQQQGCTRQVFGG
jgi:hypothetical protein